MITASTKAFYHISLFGRNYAISQLNLKIFTFIEVLFLLLCHVPSKEQLMDSILEPIMHNGWMAT